MWWAHKQKLFINATALDQQSKNFLLLQKLLLEL